VDYHENEIFLGQKTYTPFSGWQLANNALYVYRHVDSAKRKQVPTKLQQLDNMVRIYFDTFRNKTAHPTERDVLGTFYMWADRSPLQQYMKQKYIPNQSKQTSDNFNYYMWAQAAPIMSQYGSWIIRNYPLDFIKYYIIINAANYFFPTTEFLGEYNTNLNNIQPIAQTWFELKSRKIRSNFMICLPTVLKFSEFLQALQIQYS